MQESQGSHLEIERKFLVKSATKAPDSVSIGRVWIVQSYLTVLEGDVTERVRQSFDGKETVYTHTHKKRVSDGVHKETELVIEAEEYGKLLSRVDPNLHDIHKTRYTFPWAGLVWEYDVYAGRLSGIKVLEVELQDLNTSIDIPPFIVVDREVTHDRSYSNRALAER